MLHKLSDIQTNKIGKDTFVWQFCVILKNAEIGNNCNINCQVFIENDVIIGDNVTIKPGVQVWDGIRIENNVFIGPNVTFVNDKIPRSKQYPSSFQKTIVKHNSSIGANATILGGITIGAYAMVGAGSVVTKDVPSRALVVGNPAVIKAWINKDGSKMISLDNNKYKDNENIIWLYHNNKLIKTNE